MESNHSHGYRPEFMSMFCGYGARIVSTFGGSGDCNLIHTWRRHRKKTETLETNTSQIDHIAITPGLENIRNMVGTWLMQQKICKTRSWIIRKSDHWPVLQALRWRGMDGAFSGGTNSGQKSFESKKNSASLKGVRAGGRHEQSKLSDQFNYRYFLFQHFGAVSARS